MNIACNCLWHRATVPIIVHASVRNDANPRSSAPEQTPAVLVLRAHHQCMAGALLLDPRGASTQQALPNPLRSASAWLAP